MSIMVGKDRPHRQWLELLHSVGFKVIQIWNLPDGGNDEGINKAMLSVYQIKWLSNHIIRPYRSSLSLLNNGTLGCYPTAR